MNQIWTNPSLQRSFTAANLQGYELGSFLRLTFCNHEILVFTNMEYKVSFYDANDGIRKTIVGLVTNVYEDQIKIKTFDSGNSVDCAKCTNASCHKKRDGYKDPVPPMPTCHCILNPPKVERYDDPAVYFIPIKNIVSINYIKDDANNILKGVYETVLLGISATMVKTVIIHLEFFDDHCHKASKCVDIEKDGVYHIVYEDKVSRSIFEIDGRIHSINEISNQPADEYSHVHENVGFHNSVLRSDSCDCCHTKDDFMNEPPVRKVAIVVDTSKDFSGSYETIMLDSIQDCILIEKPENSNATSDIICNNQCKCHIPVEYEYENGIKVIVDGQNISIHNTDGQATELDIDSLLKNYLGI